MIIVAINDISFMHPFASQEQANVALHDLLNICLEIKKSKYRNVGKIWCDCINVQNQIAPGCKLIKIVQNFRTHDQRSFLLTLLANSPHPPHEGNPFCIGTNKSYACAIAHRGVVISLNSCTQFQDGTISGTLNGEPCDICNISQILHINQHSKVLGRRIYENNPKHRAKVYRQSGHLVSIMDLGDEQAQKVLDAAVEIDGHFYGKRENYYYEFRNHRDNFYHGYRNDQLDILVKNKIDILLT